MKLDAETMKQLRIMIGHETVKNARIMPDAHRGAGNCVGFTSQLTEKILPRFIGGDIGCGILTYNIGKIDNLDTSYLKELDENIKNRIPIGSGKRNIWKTPIVSDEDIAYLCNESYEQALNFAKGYFTHFNVDIKNLIPSYSKNWLIEKCYKIGVSYDEIICSIASLGGGNHFIEINQSTNTHNIYVTIHTGSRVFGHYIFEYHNQKIENTRHFDYNEFKDFMDDIRQKKIIVPKILKQYEDDYIQNFVRGKHTDYLENDEAYEYFFDMIFAQNIAKLNRRCILREILKMTNTEYHEENIVESIHNYINFDDMILRKGAVSAHEGELCLIALNMRDGILLCRGKGNDEWNNSTAHGAGRQIIRGHAHNKISMREFQESMENVYSTSVTVNTLDESPQCYKNSNMIMELIDPSVEILDILKPIMNIKAEN
jgi:RNA-splicing ligase RtcB